MNLPALKQDSRIAHFIGRLMDAEVRPAPFSHIYVTRAFPQEYYFDLLQNLPDDSKYTDRQFANRMIATVRGLSPFWNDCAHWMLDKHVIFNIMEVLGVKERNIEAEVRLVRDSAGYKIAPHTDVKKKLVSLLFYLAHDANHPEEGTTVMVPKQKGFTSDGSRRFPFEDFDNLYTAPFEPNTMLGFPRSDVSFHGVVGTNLPRRDVLLLNLYRP